MARSILARCTHARAIPRTASSRHESLDFSPNRCIGSTARGGLAARMDPRLDPMDFTLPPDVVTAHAASLRALARSLALDEHAADDVVQETWLRALSSPPVRHEGIGGWLRRVAEGFALKRHRSESRRVDRERKY